MPKSNKTSDAWKNKPIWREWFRRTGEYKRLTGKSRIPESEVERIWQECKDAVWTKEEQAALDSEVVTALLSLVGLTITKKGKAVGKRETVEASIPVEKVGDVTLAVRDLRKQPFIRSVKMSDDLILVRFRSNTPKEFLQLNTYLTSLKITSGVSYYILSQKK